MYILNNILAGILTSTKHALARALLIIHFILLLIINLYQIWIIVNSLFINYTSIELCLFNLMPKLQKHLYEVL